MGYLFNTVKSLKSLHRAWKKIQENGRYSESPQTRTEIANFSIEEIANLRHVQRQLGRGEFEFEKQLGITKKKQGGGNIRPLVIAPVANRIVQRAILDVLVARVRVIQSIMDTPTSIGGIPRRGTRHAIALVFKAIDDGAHYFIRSDIEAFFTKIPRVEVQSFLSDSINEADFLLLFERALKTELINLDRLAE